MSCVIPTLYSLTVQGLQNSPVLLFERLLFICLMGMTNNEILLARIIPSNEPTKYHTDTPECKLNQGLRTVRLCIGSFVRLRGHVDNMRCQSRNHDRIQGGCSRQA